MLFELCTAQLDVLFGIQKAIGGTVQGYETMTAGYVFQQCIFLAFAYLFCVCVDEKGVELIKPFASERCVCIVTVFDFDANACHRLLNSSIQGCRLMVAIVT